MMSHEMKSIICHTLSFVVILTTCIVFLSCEKASFDPGQWQNVQNPIPDSFDCVDNTAFPEVPGWKHTEIKIPNSFNRGWKPYFLNAETGLLYGSDGMLLRSTNGGKSWGSAGNKPELSYHDMHFLDEQIGFLSALDRNDGDPDIIGGVLLKSRNSGKSWIKYTYNPKGTLGKIYFLDEEHGFAEFRQYYLNSSGENSSYLARTDDGGRTWTEVDGVTPLRSVHNTLHIFPNGFGYLGGIEGKVYTTTDFGDSWTAIETGLSRFSRVQFLNSLDGFVSGYKIMLKTTDGGVTWTPISQLNTDFFHFFNPMDGFSLQVVSSYLDYDVLYECVAFLTTNDGGNSWYRGESSFGFHIGEAFFLNDKLGFSSRGFNPGTFVKFERD
jgi:photosystem II stability/assembly factor-like uncharacterized protein